MSLLLNRLSAERLADAWVDRAVRRAMGTIDHAFVWIELN